MQTIGVTAHGSQDGSAGTGRVMHLHRSADARASDMDQQQLPGTGDSRELGNSYLEKIRSILGKPSYTSREIDTWRRLRPGERRVLLKSAGMAVCHRVIAKQWHDFTGPQREALRRAVRNASKWAQDMGLEG